ncbi:peptide deformylase [Candidatus Azambacteria bacterium]|nr:peptide deformylase [Candidatus Azambacteria bacterium]
MKKEIITLNNEVLRVKAEKISEPTSLSIKAIIKNMRDTLKKTPNGVGLAAPQIGISQKIFIIDQKLAKQLQISDVFINPEITRRSFRKEKLEEGCLSVPGIYGFIKRHKIVEAKALNEFGQEFTIKTSGLLAQIIQHEVDHLGGILFIDKATGIFKVEKEKQRNLKS